MWWLSLDLSRIKDPHIVSRCAVRACQRLANEWAGWGKVCPQCGWLLFGGMGGMIGVRMEQKIFLLELGHSFPALEHQNAKLSGLWIQGLHYCARALWLCIES